MCGRYYIDEYIMDKLERLYASEFRSSRVGEMTPGAAAPVLTADGEKLTIKDFFWGYPGNGGKGLLINARAETAMEKASFYDGIRDHRIVLPAARYFEWNRQKEKNEFSRHDGEILYMAGFYDLFDGKARFVILTTAANESVQPVHHRMPLILEAHQVKEWIRDDQSTERILSQTMPTLARKSDYEQLSFFD